MKVTEQLRTLAINFNGKYEYRQLAVEIDKLEKIELERELAVEDYDGFVDALMLVQPSTVREIDIINQIFDTIGWIESETDESETDESDAPATEPASAPAEVEAPAEEPTPASEPASAPVEEAEEAVEVEEPAEASEATTETEEAEESEEAPKKKKSNGKK